MLPDTRPKRTGSATHRKMFKAGSSNAMHNVLPKLDADGNRIDAPKAKRGAPKAQAKVQKVQEVQAGVGEPKFDKMTKAQLVAALNAVFGNGSPAKALKSKPGCKAVAVQGPKVIAKKTNNRQHAKAAKTTKKAKEASRGPKKVPKMPVAAAAGSEQGAVEAAAGPQQGAAEAAPAPEQGAVEAAAGPEQGAAEAAAGSKQVGDNGAPAPEFAEPQRKPRRNVRVVKKVITIPDKPQACPRILYCVTLPKRVNTKDVMKMIFTYADEKHTYKMTKDPGVQGTFPNLPAGLTMEVVNNKKEIVLNFQWTKENAKACEPIVVPVPLEQALSVDCNFDHERTSRSAVLSGIMWTFHVVPGSKDHDAEMTEKMEKEEEYLANYLYGCIDDPFCVNPIVVKCRQYTDFRKLMFCKSKRAAATTYSHAEENVDTQVQMFTTFTPAQVARLSVAPTPCNDDAMSVASDSGNTRKREAHAAPAVSSKRQAVAPAVASAVASAVVETVTPTATSAVVSAPALGRVFDALPTTAPAAAPTTAPVAAPTTAPAAAPAVVSALGSTAAPALGSTAARKESPFEVQTRFFDNILGPVSNGSVDQYYDSQESNQSFPRHQTPPESPSADSLPDNQQGLDFELMYGPNSSPSAQTVYQRNSGKQSKQQAERSPRGVSSTTCPHSLIMAAETNALNRFMRTQDYGACETTTTQIGNKIVVGVKRRPEEERGPWGNKRVDRAAAKKAATVQKGMRYIEAIYEARKPIPQFDQLVSVMHSQDSQDSQASNTSSVLRVQRTEENISAALEDMFENQGKTSVDQDSQEHIVHASSKPIARHNAKGRRLDSSDEAAVDQAAAEKAVADEAVAEKAAAAPAAAEKAAADNAQTRKSILSRLSQPAQSAAADNAQTRKSLLSRLSQPAQSAAADNAQTRKSILSRLFPSAQSAGKASSGEVIILDD